MIQAKSRRAVELSTTFRVPCWEELPDASAAPLVPLQSRVVVANGCGSGSHANVWR